MEATETPVNVSAKIRPTFLTVICILSFIGSGWGVISSVRSYLTADTMATVTSQKIADAQDKMDSDSPGFLKSLMSSAAAISEPAIIRKSSGFSLLSCLLTLSGALMMWMLKKPGFYLYIAGTLVAIAYPFMLFSGIIAGTSAGGSALIGGIFIIMYGVNLKYME